MSSNTTFSSQGNFNRPSITKLNPQKDIVNIIILGSTFILLLIPFIDSISHFFGGNFKYNSPKYFPIYIIVVSGIFIFSIINILKNWNNRFSSSLFKNFYTFLNILYIVGTIAFIIMLVEINNNINYIKTLWDFSNVHTQTEKNQKLDLCISAYFGTTDNQWLWISISVFIISICSLLALKSPIPTQGAKMTVAVDVGIFSKMLVFAGPIILYHLFYNKWFDRVFSGTANITCNTSEDEPTSE